VLGVLFAVFAFAVGTAGLGDVDLEDPAVSYYDLQDDRFLMRMVAV
jgi:hypothetical protein